jgi:amidase
VLNPDADDAELFSSQPVCLQIVGFPYKDEELIAVSEVLDGVINV